MTSHPARCELGPTQMIVVEIPKGSPNTYEYAPSLGSWGARDDALTAITEPRERLAETR